MRARVLDTSALPGHQTQLSDGQVHSGDGGFSGSLGLQLNENVPSTSNQSKVGQEDPWSKHMPLSDISRTPSQSTTATSKSSNSLETAASSLQSGPSSSTDIKGEEQEHLQDDLPLHSFGPQASASTSPAQYVTACPSPEDENFQRRETDELRRFHALHELVETERTYAEDLYILHAIFLANLPNQAYFEESEERVRVVSRNATQLLELHSKLSQAWDAIMSEQGVNLQTEGSIDTKAARCGEAIRQIASCLTRFVRLFREYRFFCSRHAEALVVIREAERRHNGDDFAAYERTCGNMVRARFRSPTISVRPKSSLHIASASVPSTPSIATINMHGDRTSMSIAPSSGTTTPGDSFGSLSVQRSSGKLVFADYLIKPVQRLCLYPLVLNALMKYTPIHESTTRDALQLAIDAMRNIADEVDEASRAREKDLMAQLTLSRIEPVGDLSYTFLKSLGPPQLSGTLDVLHHHSVEEPLTSPLRFHHMGVIMWANYIVFVRTRKNSQLECRFWFPLEDAIVTPKDGAKEQSERDHADKDETTLATLELAGRPLLPFAFRMTFKQSHHFELSASHESEFRMWYDALRLACMQAKKQLPSLPDETSKSRQDQTQNHNQKQQRYACSLSSDNGQSSGGALLSEYLAVNLKQPLVSSLDNLIKLPSVTARNAIDRSMIFSDLLVAPVGVVGLPTTMVGGASALKEISEALVAQQLRQNAAPSIGSAVGAAMGLAKMAATQKMPTVKRPRKMSSNIWQGDLTASSIANLAGHESDAASVSPASDERSTSKRVSLRNLRMSSTHGNHANNQTGSILSGDGSSASSRRLSSPVISTFGSRMRGSIMRANSRAGHSTPSSVAGSLPTSPNGSALDLTETISPTSGGDSESDTLRPSHQRSKSNALREVWSSTIAARRVRSKSAQSVFTMGPPYEGSVLASGELHSSPTSLEPSARSVNGSLESLHQSPLSFETLRGDSATLPPLRGSRMPSAPTSGRSSRRQSIVSLLSLSNFDQGSSSPPMPRSSHSSRPSSPALNILQVREGAAAKLKHAKSAVRNRLSMSSTSTSSMAKPLATSTTAQGWMSHTNAFAAQDEILEEMADSRDAQLAPAAPSTASSSSSSSSETDVKKEKLKRSATIADRLRGSLSRKSSLLRLQSLSLEARRSETNLSERFNRVADVAPASAATEADVADEMTDKYDDAYLPTLQETLSAENSHDAA